MGVFPLLEDFQGSRDNVEFMRGMPRRGSFLSPDSITSRAQFPASESSEENGEADERGSRTRAKPLADVMMIGMKPTAKHNRNDEKRRFEMLPPDC